MLTTDHLLVGRYQLRELAGSGGMAQVWRAHDIRRHVDVAVKLLREDLAEDVVLVQRFRNEAEALRRLDHPHIVRFYSFEIDGPLAFLVTDFIRGETLRLRIRLRGGPLGLFETVDLLGQIASALAYAHSEGIIHRDVKPGNIMIDQQERVYLTDFGIARLLEAGTITMQVPGTPDFMAPEQWRGQGMDGRTDVYGLGVTAYSMLTGGMRPFLGETPEVSGTYTERVMYEHLNVPPLPPSHYNPDLVADIDHAILSALAKDRGQRTPSVIDLVKDLQHAISAPPARAGTRLGADGREPDGETTAVDGRAAISLAEHAETISAESIASSQGFEPTIANPGAVPSEAEDPTIAADNPAPSLDSHQGIRSEESAPPTLVHTASSKTRGAIDIDGTSMPRLAGLILAIIGVLLATAAILSVLSRCSATNGDATPIPLVASDLTRTALAIVPTPSRTANIVFTPTTTDAPTKIAEPTMTNTSTPSNTPSPTWTASPTVTRVPPTATPTRPTATPSHTPTQIPTPVLAITPQGTEIDSDGHSAFPVYAVSQIRYQGGQLLVYGQVRMPDQRNPDQTWELRWAGDDVIGACNLAPTSNRIEWWPVGATNRKDGSSGLLGDFPAKDINCTVWLRLVVWTNNDKDAKYYRFDLRPLLGTGCQARRCPA